jgi:hypothetical protein
VSGLIGDEDTLDAAIELTRDRSDAVIVMSDRDTSLSGSVEDAAGQPLHEGTIVIFPADPRLRVMGGRRVRILELLPGGRFTASSLPAGEYLAVAGPNIAPGGQLSLADLESLETRATRVVLVLGEQKRITIRQGRTI